jgi:hypothetical protein
MAKDAAAGHRMPCMGMSKKRQGGIALEWTCMYFLINHRETQKSLRN